MTSAKSLIIASYLDMLMTAAENNYGKRHFSEWFQNLVSLFKIQPPVSICACHKQQFKHSGSQKTKVCQLGRAETCMHFSIVSHLLEYVHRDAHSGTTKV